MTSRTLSWPNYGLPSRVISISLHFGPRLDLQWRKSPLPWHSPRYQQPVTEIVNADVPWYARPHSIPLSFSKSHGSFPHTQERKDTCPSMTLSDQTRPCFRYPTTAKAMWKPARGVPSFITFDQVSMLPCVPLPVTSSDVCAATRAHDCGRNNGLW
ncbi:hypothetical protein EJ08DRAFT_79771 [Tothia fuscella]|uniref:Uncharacterized protein n=1 Tax=Tothia fuscella TaxID=1048955 RepID=A0A9P4NEI1_9PEZI|nr:hypothetical protein EJ08DRAFT_79771 [Tothia fuscella]